MSKQYADAAVYERKLQKVMERMAVEEYIYDFNCNEAWVEFLSKGKPYRFECTKSKAEAMGLNLVCDLDYFAQVILALEKFAGLVDEFSALRVN